LFVSLGKSKKRCNFLQRQLAPLIFNKYIISSEAIHLRNHHCKDHTKRWSAKIDSFDAFIFVTPKYNHGITGALKNAIDFLYREWQLNQK
jgi:NAD(P)H-dependent FMN reductase